MRGEGGGSAYLPRDDAALLDQAQLAGPDELVVVLDVHPAVQVRREGVGEDRVEGHLVVVVGAPGGGAGVLHGGAAGLVVAGDEGCGWGEAGELRLRRVGHFCAAVLFCLRVGWGSDGFGSVGS